MNINYDNSLSDKYDIVRERHVDIQNILNEYIHLRKNNHIHVDLGCGTCKETYVLKDNIWSFIGIDLSEKMLSIARTKINTGLFIRADLQYKIPLLNESVDSISIISFYHHIVDKEKFFSEVSRVLKKNGILIIITNTIEQLERREYYSFF